MKKLRYIILVAVLMLTASFAQAQKSIEDAERYISEGSLPIDQLRELFGQHGCIGDFESFISDEADCNQGAEPLRDFVFHMNADPEFRYDRMKMVKQGVPYTDFLFHMDKDKRRLRYWRNVRENSAEYAVSWFVSDLIYVYYFQRIDGKWQMVNFFEKNNRY